LISRVLCGGALAAGASVSSQASSCFDAEFYVSRSRIKFSKISSRQVQRHNKSQNSDSKSTMLFKIKFRTTYKISC